MKKYSLIKTKTQVGEHPIGTIGSIVHIYEPLPLVPLSYIVEIDDVDYTVDENDIEALETVYYFNKKEMTETEPMYNPDVYNKAKEYYKSLSDEEKSCIEEHVGTYEEVSAVYNANDQLYDIKPWTVVLGLNNKLIAEMDFELTYQQVDIPIWERIKELLKQ